MTSKGKKIKDLAFSFFIVMAIAIIVGAILVATSDSVHYVLRIGRVMAWVGSILAAFVLLVFAYFLYLFTSTYGEMAEDLREIRLLLEGKKEKKVDIVFPEIDDMEGVSLEKFEELQSDENIKKMLEDIID